MQNFQTDFIELAIKHGVLCFGEFALKSGRISPYFFNAGKFNTGRALHELGSCYAKAINHAQLQVDCLFGPAYKGINLACSTAIAFDQLYNRDLPFCFNRKETKDHGEGGQLIGAALQGNIVLIDDVITAGTAFREANQIIEQAGAKLSGVIVAIDRQERGQTDKSAIEEIRDQHNIPVISIITLNNIITYLNQQPKMQAVVDNILEYRRKYGVDVVA